MKISTFVVGLIALLTPVNAAWSKDDREIFRVRAEIQTAEGSDVTFYDYMGIPPNADLEAIKKAYRKKTRELHPDKVRQRLVAAKSAEAVKSGKKAVQPTRAELKKANKEAIDKQARLTIINDILRSPARNNYDFYLANGFPLWKGTDYYYQRYRPSLGIVLTIFIIVVGGGFHYLALYIGWKQNRDFIARHVKYARDQAMDELTRTAVTLGAPKEEQEEQEEQAEQPPLPRNRRERRFMEKQERADGKKPTPKRKAKPAAAAVAAEETEEPIGPMGARRRVLAQNGKILVVDSQGDVFLEDYDVDGNTNLILLDPEELPQPTIHDTAIVRFPLFIVNTVKSRLGLSKAEPIEETTQEDSSSDFEIVDASDIAKGKASGVQSNDKKANKRQ